jgi:hypothetical protein
MGSAGRSHGRDGGRNCQTGSEDDDQRDRFRRRVLDRLPTFRRTAGIAYGEGFKRVDDL